MSSQLSPSAAAKVAVPAFESTLQEEMSTVRPSGTVRRYSSPPKPFSKRIQSAPGAGEPDVDVTPLVFQPKPNDQPGHTPRRPPPPPNQRSTLCHPVFAQA